ncbi:hypothetical protein Trydic_g15314 [Trypoxylus dichotomus]
MNLLSQYQIALPPSKPNPVQNQQSLPSATETHNIPPLPSFYSNTTQATTVPPHRFANFGNRNPTCPYANPQFSLRPPTIRTKPTAPPKPMDTSSGIKSNFVRKTGPAKFTAEELHNNELGEPYFEPDPEYQSYYPEFYYPETYHAEQADEQKDETEQ